MKTTYFFQLFFLNFMFNINQRIILTFYLIIWCTKTKTPFETYIHLIVGAHTNLISETLDKVVYY